MAARFKARQSFTVPLTSGQYAPERIAFPGAEASNAGLAPDPGLLGLTAQIESNTATGAVLEIWLLKIGGTPGTDADYSYSGQNVASGVLTVALASYPGAQIRVRSTGTAGTLVANASAD